MPAVDESPRERLARAVADRRRRMSLSVSAAARAAGIDRGTWTGVEQGSRETEEYNYSRIERVLSWEAGTIDKILAGTADTEPLPDMPLPIRKGELDPDVARIIAILDDPQTSDAMRAWIRDQLRALAQLPTRGEHSEAS